jgi:hypothetical protein
LPIFKSDNAAVPGVVDGIGGVGEFGDGHEEGAEIGNKVKLRVDEFITIRNYPDNYVTALLPLLRGHSMGRDSSRTRTPCS